MMRRKRTVKERNKSREKAMETRRRNDRLNVSTHDREWAKVIADFNKKEKSQNA
jgi:hypothetical protein